MADGNWRIVIEGTGGFCRGGNQLAYDADYIGKVFAAELVTMKQTVTRAQFDTVPNTDAFTRDLRDLRDLLVP